MTAYEWLKANPKRNDRILKFGWSSEEIPYAVLGQVKAMVKAGLPTTDAYLFWDGYFTERKMVAVGKELAALKRKKLVVSNWVEPAYLLQQTMPSPIVVGHLFDWLTSGELIDVDLTSLQRQEMLQSMLVHAHRHDFKVATAQFRWLTKLTVNSNMATKLLRHIPVSILQQEPQPDFNELFQLLLDLPDDDTVYSSLNAVRRAHDERAVQESQKQLDRYSGIRFDGYDPEFVELCKEYGFRLPMEPNDLIKRGAAHHNCVGSYITAHATGDCIILLADDATCELRCEVRLDLIVSTTVQQYKGYANKDKPHTENLIKLRIALTGRSARLISIGEVTHGNERADD